ncbi:MAG: hypothetical protein AW07_01895 [Candidatus Accumulibacter sp. SK-11]|nr:MAG: hypothetical protein AW07_01895 [Candidatus Accumulibacter sp. SK-11]
MMAWPRFSRVVQRSPSGRRGGTSLPRLRFFASAVSLGGRVTASDRLHPAVPSPLLRLAAATVGLLLVRRSLARKRA